MRCPIIILLLILLVGQTYAQRIEGLINQPDTSFTNYSAYKSAKKKYSDIILVKDSLPPPVKVERNLSYPNLDKQPLPIDAFYPKKHSKKKLPAIIIIHGGGWRSGNRTQHYPLAERLAENGFVCFTPAYRLSTEALFPAAVQDLKSAISWVRTNANRFNIDTNKIAVLGFSAGGQLAALLGTTANNSIFTNGDKDFNKYAVQAIVDIDGILAFIHPESGEGDDSKTISAATNWFGYNKKDEPNLYEMASALSYVGSHTPPTLFVNSSVDRMHAGRNDFVAELNKFGIYNEVHTFPDTPHTFCLFEPWFTPTVNYVTVFLNKVFVSK
ncbi:alpha/beta hydrolase [Mucilaginibacter agri]|uniref:Alpha/beta hydrolase fold domain-containing protein n=1 Tax=Mucilaginibacter agri TaxID=2695265 RepID=A0A965ZL69_9SPHI|nr:alpha/beta hydrolase [Mucilaginibacter agri]NCD71631.1 alpha/beta hydrolase fold domain-containing protein [Mucilaginibacter agri]